MNIITIPKRMAENDDLIVMPRKEYEHMKTRMFPEVYLSGRKAERLDRRVGKALLDFRQGKTKKVKSLAELG